MPEPPRRKRFQIHLSTAVVLMIAAGGLMWLNVRGTMTETRHAFPEFPEARSWKGEFGWPFIALTRLEWRDSPTMPLVDNSFWDSKNVVMNILAAMYVLFWVWFVCEWWIRRSAARKQGGGAG